MRLHGLDLNLLLVLETLLTEKSVRRTAEQLHMSQPAVSGALKRLREHFGDELLVMKGRTLHLTEFGGQLLEPIQESLARLRSIAVATPSFDPYANGRQFTVIVSEGLAGLLTNLLARRFVQANYSISIKWLTNTTASFERFSRGQADLLLLRDGFDFPSRLLFHDTFSVVAWQGNGLLGEAISADQYSDMEHVLIDIGERMNAMSVADARLRQLGVERRSRVTVAGYGLAPTAVIGTNLLTTLPTRLAAMLATWLPLKVLPLPFDLRPFAQNAYWHPFSDDDRALQWLIDEIVDVARSIAPDEALPGR